MKKDHDFDGMSVDELWSLHEQVTSELALQIEAKRETLDQRLRQLSVTANGNRGARRPYPPVYPKYRNSSHPDETWAGRGKQPRWLTAQLKSGKALDEFRI
jgi:DNA-binding protein H-NS